MYLIWFGDQSNDENETSIGGSLGEVALRSGGEILQVTEESLGNGETGLVNNILFSNLNGFYFFIFPHVQCELISLVYLLFLFTILQVTHFLQNDIQGAQVLEIPVNKTDTNLHVKIQGYVDEAILSTPNDGQ